MIEVKGGAEVELDGIVGVSMLCLKRGCEEQHWIITERITIPRNTQPQV
jgi:hypothetical protein